MTDKQMRFCEEYLIDTNATRAYKAAYPNVKSDGSGRACASKLLSKPNIREYIDSRLEKIHSEKTADAKEVMEYLTSVMRGTSLAETVVIEGEGDGVSRAKRMMKSPDEKEKLKAAELIGKRYGIFKDNVDVQGAVPVQIIYDIPTGGDDDAASV